jgi:hypothetical protein
MWKPASHEVVVLVLVLMLAPYVQAQTNANEYTKEMALAKSYVQERRFDEALDALNKAYQAKPENDALIQMGYVFLSQGKEAEALDVFNHVLSEGGEIPIDMQHPHAMGACRGTLSISAQKIRWSNTEKKETFDVAPAQVEKSYTHDQTGRLGTGTFPFVILRVNGKEWRFVYLLYGANARYSQSPWWIVYQGDELERAKKANSVVAQLVTSAATVKVGSVMTPQSNTASVPSTTAPASQKAEVAGSAVGGAELTEGQTPDAVEKILGKPDDIISVKETSVYVYPTVKVFFENGRLVNVEERKK